MKTYLIVMRNGTVTFTHNVMAARCNRAKAAVLALYADHPGTYLYKMHRVG